MLKWVPDEYRRFRYIRDEVSSDKWNTGEKLGWFVCTDFGLGCIWGEKLDNEFFANWIFDERVPGREKVGGSLAVIVEIAKAGCDSVSGIIRSDNVRSLALARYIGFNPVESIIELCNGENVEFKKVIKHGIGKLS